MIKDFKFQHSFKILKNNDLNVTEDYSLEIILK